MTTLTIPAMVHAQERLARVVFEHLHSSHAPHYRSADESVLRARADLLAAKLVHSVTEDAATLCNHLRAIAQERIGEGYALEELQLALNVLEQEAWAVVAETQGLLQSELVAQLALLSSVCGAAKDQLARVYFASKERAEMRVVELERRVDAMMKGTVGGDVAE